ncbi:MAG TPA: DNA helicase RecQ [Flavobacteriales bacterium]|nr:DNA helicase RecQ [Flavobacteriales bacterium]
MTETALLSLNEHLKEYFGFSNFKGQQEGVIHNILKKKDTFVIMPTGGGKSICYQLPALINDGTAIIVSPLIALMKNQVDAMRGYGSEDGIAHFMNSSLTKPELALVKQDLLGKKTKLLYVAPESLTKQENIDFFKNIEISFFAIDEAHCISEWGHDFRPEYRRLRTIIEAIGKVPIMALTATATPKVQQDIQKNLAMGDTKVFKSSFNRANLYYEVKPKANAKKEIIRHIKNNPGKSGIIYCLSRKKVEEIAETLKVNGIKALPYHAGMEQALRAKTQDDFLMENIDVIVATIAFGMGIDKPDVRFVIHYDIPKSLEGYYQETGRAGRDDGEGKCIAFYQYKDIEKLEKFMKGKPVAEQEVGRQLLLETVAYAESAMCRRKQLLHYFGETYPKDNCNNCDNCLNPKERFEAMDNVFLALKTILAIKEKFKIKHVVNVLIGKTTTEVKSYKHDTLEEFNGGADYDEAHWNAVIRQALILGFLKKAIEHYGLLSLTEAGHNFLNKPFSVMVAKDHEYEDIGADGGEMILSEQKGGGIDTMLFSMLKDLRKQIAESKGVPPYIVFGDPSLEDMTIQFPITMEEMCQISGVGPGKASKFGKPLIELIANYVEENEIERPIDMVVKSVVNKSGLKVYIIKSIDRKLPLDDIAKAKGVTMEELITELERIVSSGTRLDISYYLMSNMDQEHAEEIMEYFKEEEGDSIEKAIEEFEEYGFTEEQIRLVRIKFISEFGN